MKKFKVGLIGYGWTAGAHIDALNATGRAEVTAVCSARALNEADLARRHGGAPRAFERAEDLLADPEIEVVDITGYPSQHAQQFIAAVEAGKHVILEKPMALTWEDCRRMKDALDRSGRQACVCFEVRHSSQFKATRSVLDRGLLGELHYGEIDYYHGIGPWYGQYRWNIRSDEGGSSLLSAGCHALDALLLCMPGKVESVYSSSARSRHPAFAKYEYPTTSVTIVNFTDGAVGKAASVIDCLQPYYIHTHLVGSEGALLDDRFYSERIQGLKKDWSRLNFSLTDSGDVNDHPYQAQFESFLEALERGAPMPLTDFATAYETFRVIFAADQSANEGRPVSMEEIHA